MVAESTPRGEFYAEVTDRRRIHAASWFALDAVLPQFGKIAHAACSYATLGARLCVFIDRMIASQDTNEPIEIAFSYDLDWELAERAMRDSGGYKGDVTRQLNPHNVYDVVGFGAGKRAAEAYFEAEIDASISRHHSLCNARALRIAYEAAKRPRSGMHLTEPFLSASARSPARIPAFQEATA